MVRFFRKLLSGEPDRSFFVSGPDGTILSAATDPAPITPEKLRWAEGITDALARMANVNRHDFSQDQSLCEAYKRNLRNKRHKYVSDKLTCGHDDCWSTYKSLVRRYQKDDPNGTIELDCEDAACAHSGWLAAQCYGADTCYVGLVPGRRVSHAVSGVLRGKPSAINGPERIQIIDPARWFGMGPTSYNNIVWRQVA
jgi:hypothetical protein